MRFVLGMVAGLVLSALAAGALSLWAGPVPERSAPTAEVQSLQIQPGQIQPGQIQPVQIQPVQNQSAAAHAEDSAPQSALQSPAPTIRLRRGTEVTSLPVQDPALTRAQPPLHTSPAPTSPAPASPAPPAQEQTVLPPGHDPFNPTLARIDALRAEVMAHRARIRAAHEAAETARLRKIRAFALRPEADLDFDAATQPQAAALRTACAAQDPAACRDLAALYDDPTGGREDRPLALALRMVGCLDGDDAACMTLHEMPEISSGDYAGPAPHWDATRRTCAAGDAAACMFLASGHAHGAPGLLQDAEQAGTFYSQACALGMDWTCGYSPDLRQVLDRHRAACADGARGGCLREALLLLKPGTEVHDPTRGMALLQARCDAAEDGGSACFQLARHVWRGTTAATDQEGDPDGALALYEQGCRQGLTLSCARAAQSHRSRADNTPETRQAAIRFLTTACAAELDTSTCAPLQELDPDAAPLRAYSEKLAAQIAQAQADQPPPEAQADQTLAQAQADPLPSPEALLARRAARASQMGVLQAALVDSYDLFVPAYHGRVRRARTACRDGDPQGCVQLGHYFYTEYASGSTWGVVHELADRAAARALFAQACDMGDPEGCYQVAESHTGIGDESDPKTEIAHLIRACDKNHAAACTQLGNKHAHGFDMPEDHAAAEPLLQKGCALGDVYGCTSLGDLIDLPDKQRSAHHEVMACLYGGNCSNVATYIKHGRYGYTANRQVARRLMEVSCADAPGYSRKEVCAELERF